MKMIHQQVCILETSVYTQSAASSQSTHVHVFQCKSIQIIQLEAVARNQFMDSLIIHWTQNTPNNFQQKPVCNYTKGINNSHISSGLYARMSTLQLKLFYKKCNSRFPYL